MSKTYVDMGRFSGRLAEVEMAVMTPKLQNLRQNMLDQMTAVMIASHREASGMSDYTRIQEQFPGDAVRVYGQPCGLKICVTRTLADAAQITVPYLVTYNEMGDDARMQVVCARIRLMVDHEARYYEAGGVIENSDFEGNNAAWAVSPGFTIERLRATARMLRSRDAADQYLEVDYARDLDDATTFTEALAALEAHKARRGRICVISNNTAGSE